MFLCSWIFFILILVTHRSSIFKALPFKGSFFSMDLLTTAPTYAFDIEVELRRGIKIKMKEVMDGKKMVRFSPVCIKVTKCYRFSKCSLLCVPAFVFFHLLPILCHPHFSNCIFRASWWRRSGSSQPSSSRMVVRLLCCI